MIDMHNDNDNDIHNDNGKDIDNIGDIDNENEFKAVPLTKEELLAKDLAKGLDDEANLRFYLSVCRKYPEQILREIYGQVKQVPKNKIRKSKGALFNYLIQKHEKNRHCH